MAKQSQSQFITMQSQKQLRKKTGCDEYVEDQLNVGNKNFAKYPFDDTDSKRYLEDICSMKGWSDKDAILNLFSRLNLSALHTKFHTSQPPPYTFFANNFANI